MGKKFDFSGWATKANMRCADGVTILKDAFKECDGIKVPLVWNHQHNSADEVLGHALLENRPEGVYAYCTFNDTQSGQNAKLLVQHGDVDKLSIYANRLKKQGSNVVHGIIRELSLVLAGANPGAVIDSVIMHGDYGDETFEEGYIFSGEYIENVEPLTHADTDEKGEKEMEVKSDSEKTVQDVFDTLNEEQKTVVYAMIGQALEDAGVDSDDEEDEGGNDNMKHNLFDQDTKNEHDDILTHSEMAEIFSEAKRNGSLADTVLQHGIEQIDVLFPDAQAMANEPGFIKRDDSWVAEVMNAVHKTPFSRIKSVFADITEDDARAKGYVKGNKKVDEVFSLLKRITTPTTVYKKQKIDRDDIVDITDFSVVAWLKKEMRMMLDEEIARAVLVGDGRNSSSNDKINEQNIRPIWTDDDVYTIKAVVNVTDSVTADERARAFIRACIKSRKGYKGSGNPIMYMSEDMLTDCLLLEDANKRIIYDSVEKLATALRVRKIVPVAVMEGLTREVGGKTHELGGIYVNLVDYNIGADKGGAVNMFDNFDIDYNAQKYLIETRCSGALVKPYSAVAIEFVKDEGAAA